MSAGDQGPAWERKLDHRLRALLARTPDISARAHQRIHVFIRFAGDPAGLRALGVDLGSVAGDIATASVHLADLPRLAGASRIAFIELSHSLAPDPA